jgi:hypothetical protein
MRKKRTVKTKAAPKPKRDQAWFERKVAELKAAIDKLPENRQEAFRQKLEQDMEK